MHATRRSPGLSLTCSTARANDPRMAHSPSESGTTPGASDPGAHTRGGSVGSGGTSSGAGGPGSGAPPPSSSSIPGPGPGAGSASSSSSGAEDRDEGGIRGRFEKVVPDLVKRTFYAGLGALFTTEEGIRKIASDFHLPKDVA